MWTSGWIGLALLSGNEALVLEPRRVEGESWREVACAQVPQDPFVEREGLFRLDLSLAGRPVRLTLVPGLDPEVEGLAGMSCLWVDANADGEEGEGELMRLDEESSNGFGHYLPLSVLDVPVVLSLYEHADQFRVTVMTLYHFEADLELDGQALRLYFLDMNLDGRVSPGDSWAVLDERQQEFVRPASLLFASNLWSEPWYVGQQVLFPVASDQDKLSFELRPQLRPRHEFLAERAARIRLRSWDAFEQERAAFLATHGIDPHRPIDLDPPAWYYAWDLDEALAFARRIEKPLYVEFGSDGCPWCKRYDWLNYRDAAVTERLRNFALVKINRDLDPDQTAPRLGLDGVPCHVLFDADGERLHSLRGWIPPGAYAQELDRTLEAWEATQPSHAE